MRSSDPAAYDQVKVLTSGSPFNEAFRALYFTHTAAATATCVITQITNGAAVTKTIAVNVPANGSFILPISGESVTVTFGGNLYALL